MENNGKITEEALEKVAAGLSVYEGTLKKVLAAAGVVVLASAGVAGGYHFYNKNKDIKNGSHEKSEIEEMDDMIGGSGFTVLEDELEL